MKELDRIRNCVESFCGRHHDDALILLSVAEARRLVAYIDSLREEVEDLSKRLSDIAEIAT